MRSSRIYTFCAWLAVALFVGILGCEAWGQTTVAAFFQPARNVPMLSAMGVNTFFGAEVENAKHITPEQFAAGRAIWIKAVQNAGAKCVLKGATGPLPPNCVGLLLSVDEPNGKLIPPSALVAERDDLRARYPGVPIYLSLAGDKITSANFAKPDELKLYQDYGACADVLTVDWYSANRNATRYPMTFTGDAVAKLRQATGKPVLAWIECNDQILAPPPPAGQVARAPTPDEIQQTVDWAMKQGAAGIGWFATCDRGKYGWTPIPGKGDSYWPLIDRNEASIQPQIDRVKAIGLALNPAVPIPSPVVDPAILALQQKLAETNANLGVAQAAVDQLRIELKQQRSDNDAFAANLNRWIRSFPATQPVQP